MKYNQVLFIKGKTRLGLLNAPYGSENVNLGVEDASDEILSQDFTHGNQVEEFLFSFPESINSDNYFEKIAFETSQCAKKINNAHKDNQLQCVIGGDHSIGFPSLLSALMRTKGKVGVVSFDSHADLNCLRTSKSGNFHGMWLRPFMDEFDNKAIADLVRPYLDRVDVLYVGNTTPGDGEKEIIEKYNMSFIESGDAGKDESKKIINEFLNSVDHIHVTFDIDVFKTDLAPATGTPNDNGYSEEELFPLLDLTTSADKSYSLDLVEINPEKNDGDKTVKLGQKVLKRMITNIMPH